MKLSLEDLEKALNWIRTNSRDVYAQVKIEDNKMSIQVKDNYEAFAEITLFSDSTMMPKIRKENIL